MTEEGRPLTKSRVVVGLGNPGKEYAHTRHNMGWMVAEKLGHDQGWTFHEEKRFNALVAKGKVGDMDVHLLLPTTFMNLSGTSLQKYLDYFKLSSNDVIVITDDVSLDFGEIRIRTFGSAGGHKGLKSIEQVIDTRHYVRMRVGIGLESARDSLADYVLDTFSPHEKERLPEVIKTAADILMRLLNEKVEQVMNQINVRKQRKNCRPLSEDQENKNESTETKSL